LAYFQNLRSSMGNPPDPARKPEVVDREIELLQKQIAGVSEKTPQ